ncbi:hypothetical protein WN59_10185 [Salinicoccus sediminis]|uniref:Asparagine synthetase domain-containing protein n=1 Tax=Salinicoccus sediminis TaxID=1432562 RepID=A0A0M2SJX3_9STAP|nr:hypothetical protein [Salinicoccus sediminis]KKK33961.1 hypothetical protein WN59_10185 [Salinicoccus sediminis]
MDRSYLSNPFSLTKKEFENKSLLDDSMSLNHAYFYYNDETKYKIFEKNGVKLILIGYILDIRDSLQTSDSITKSLLDLYSKNNNLFYENLSYLNGRFVLIFDSEDDTCVYSDATVLRPLFYWENDIVSSHEIIIREAVLEELNIELEISSFEMKNFLDYSNTNSIYKFNPNLYFSFKNQEFIRYYPKDNFGNQTLEKVLENTEDYFLPQVEWLDKNFSTIQQSLTGGFDAKLSLAINKPILSKLNFFTYMYRFNEDDPYDELSQFKKIYYKDKYIVDQLIYNFNLRHKYLFFGDYKMPKEYHEKISSHVSSHHSYILSYLTHEEFPKGSIHVKSTLYELAKQPYTGHAEMKIEDNWMIRAIKHWAPKEIREDESTLNDMYQAYFRRNKLQEVIDKGHNLPMIIYWEYRMGNWHGSLTQETDTVMETFIFINNRYMIDQLLTLKLEDKKEKKYLTELVKRFWPALNYFVSNSFDTLEDKLEETKNI